MNQYIMLEDNILNDELSVEFHADIPYKIFYVNGLEFIVSEDSTVLYIKDIPVEYYVSHRYTKR